MGVRILAFFSAKSQCFDKYLKRSTRYNPKFGITDSLSNCILVNFETSKSKFFEEYLITFDILSVNSFISLIDSARDI